MTDTIKKLAPAERIAQWLYLDAKLFPTAVKIAQGSDYAYGDMELAEWVDNLLYDTGSNAVDLLWVISYGASVAAAEHLRASFPTEVSFAAVKWGEVRTALLAYKES